MRRRDFIGCGIAAWPVPALAQQSDQMRRIGVMMAFAEDDPEASLRVTTLREELLKLGWTEGRNIRLEQHRSATDPGAISRVAIEIVDTRPDVILTDSTPPTAAVLRETHTIPVVFVQVGDPIGSGFVASFPHPGGNATGINNFPLTLTSKWLELLHSRLFDPLLSRCAGTRIVGPFRAKRDTCIEKDGRQQDHLRGRNLMVGEAW